MDEFNKIIDIQRCSRAIGAFLDNSEGNEKERCASLCAHFRKSNPLQRAGHPAVYRRSSHRTVKHFNLFDDGGEVLDVDAPLVRGPPALGFSPWSEDDARI